MFRKAIVATFLAAGLAAVGCAKDSMDNRSAKMDACKMCPGVQTATADGKCPGCGMTVAAMNAEPRTLNKRDQMNRMPNETTPASMDACAKCPGVQTMTADGKCPVCGMKVANKM